MLQRQFAWTISTYVVSNLMKNSSLLNETFNHEVIEETTYLLLVLVVTYTYC